MEMPDVAALVAFVCQEEVGINTGNRDYKRLNCRLDATKREIEAITKKTYLVVHPDKTAFKQWLQRKQIMVDRRTYG